MVGLVAYTLAVVLGVVVSYLVIRLAVRDGMVEANERIRLAKEKKADRL